MSKRLSFYFVTAISQFMLGMIMLVYALHYVQQRSILFCIPIVTDIGLMISGIIFFIMGIRKHREYAMPKEDKDIWE